VALIRAFIAIELPAPVQEALAGVQQRLRSEAGGRAGRWVRAESIHITLKFLGDIEGTGVPAVSAGMRRACAGIAPFDLIIEGLGCFPNSRRPRVVWAGISAPYPELSTLYERIEARVVRMGYAAERRRFSPHLTLARVRRDVHSRETEALGRSVTAHPVNIIGRVSVHGISLIQSELTPQGALYTPLVSVSLHHKAG